VAKKAKVSNDEIRGQLGLAMGVKPWHDKRTEHVIRVDKRAKKCGKPPGGSLQVGGVNNIRAGSRGGPGGG